MRVWFIRMFVVLVGLVVLEVVLVKYNGRPVAAPEIPRGTMQLGVSGAPLTYVVMGDSTAIAQGGDYATGIAMTTAGHLAANHRVSFTNVAISGATTQTVAEQQLSKAKSYKPDVVLLSVGANDLTHLKSNGTVHAYLNQIIAGLIAANCNVKVVLTGVAAMGSIPRFPQPLRWYAGVRTRQLNAVFQEVAASQKLTFAAIAAKTGPIFAANHQLFAPDNFHPNSQGYDVWNAVLIAALDQAFATQPTHCEQQ